MSLAISIVAAIAVAVCLRAVSGLQRKLEQLSGEIRQRSEQQAADLRETVRALEARIADLAGVRTAAPKPAPVPALAPVAAAPPKRAEEIAPELLVVMAAAVTVFLGKQVRIRSAKMLQSPYEIVNPWAQQGRVFVQASHNLWQR
ncbi:MAG TPA: hypothetical protein VLT90_09470 [Terriglobales bacterium]|nr:hypothetical protein [Terriglobales bacterium]